MPEPSLNYSPVQPAQVSIRSVVAALFRRKPLVLSLFTGILAGVALVTWLMPRKYESSMKVLVKNERPDLVVSPDAGNGGQLREDVSENEVNSEIELLTSNDLIVQVVRACHLYERASRTFLTADETPSQAFERAARKLKHDLDITPVRKANIIQITYSAPTPELAASVLRQLSIAYLDAHLNVHRTAGSQEFFRDQAARYAAKLRDAENRLSQFCLRNDLTSVAEQKDLVLRK